MMKIGKIVEKDGETNIEIDFWKTVGTIVSGMAPVMLLFAVTLPNSCTNRKIDLREEKYEYIKYSMQNQDSIARVNTINLLIEAGIICDEENELKNFIMENGVPKSEKE